MVKPIEWWFCSKCGRTFCEYTGKVFVNNKKICGTCRGELVEEAKEISFSEQVKDDS